MASANRLTTTRKKLANLFYSYIQIKMLPAV